MTNDRSRMSTNLRQFALLLLKVRVVFYVRLNFRVLGYSLQLRRVCDSGRFCLRNVPVCPSETPSPAEEGDGTRRETNS